MPEPSSPPTAQATWTAALDALELHVDEIRAGLLVGSLPRPYEVPVPAEPLPASLGERTQRVLGAQRDLEDDLRCRLGALTAALVGTAPATPTPVFLDRRD